LRTELNAARAQLATLETETDALRAQLTEATNLIELQKADLDRYKSAYERVRPNTPERVPKEQLQLAFEEILKAMSDVPAAQALADTAANDDDDEKKKRSKKPGKKSNPHGRRNLETENLPVEEILTDPEHVVAAGGVGFELIGEEVSERIAFRPGGYIRLRIRRRTWVSAGVAVAKPVTAPLPESIWPSYMADPSVIAANIISKYDDILPLHRQEKITARNGFRIPRSTQCGWLGEANAVLYRIVDAMFIESKSQAFCIATDATGAPVRVKDEEACVKWHVFVFIADHDHVVFRYTPKHSSEAVHGMLGGFRGHLLSDAAPVFDILHRDGATEVCCWFHLRRYFWSGLNADPGRALEAMSLIAKLFEIDRECRHLALPEYTEQRAARSQPVLDVFDEWVERNRDQVDPRGPIDKAIGYYGNQREALHRFLEDGRLRLDNSLSEQQLRNLALGRHNWMYFANETGVKWYTTFRSLIASCRLHDINPHPYLEEVLRLAPHWRVSRVLELAPKYWKSTRQRLDERHRQIIVPPWQRQWPHVDATAPPEERASISLSA